MYDQSQEPTPQDAPQAPDRAEEKRVDVPQNETPVETENLDTGTPEPDPEDAVTPDPDPARGHEEDEAPAVEGTRNPDLPTENFGE